MYYYTRTTLYWATEAHGLWRGARRPAQALRGSQPADQTHQEVRLGDEPIA